MQSLKSDWATLRHWYDRLAGMDPPSRAQTLADLNLNNPSLAAQLEAMLSMRDNASFLEETALKERSHQEERIGPYRLLKEIGRGGMGAVYEARREDGAFDMTVAVKLISGVLVSDGARRQFQQEREILARLDHPHITRLLDGGTTAHGQPYFVMEYVSGGRIDDYCSEHGLSVRERVRLFLQVCEAIEYAHRHLIIHRDLKPGNILVTGEGQVKILDFGIAKAISDEPATMDKTATHLWLTPEYAAPEQIRGELVTTATDVYLLGLLLYELLTGVHPFRRKDAPPHAVMAAVCDEMPLRPSSLPDASRELRGDLDQIVLMALRKEPASRYNSVDDLRRDTERYLNGLPVRAQGRSFVYRAGKFLRRNWIGMSAAALIAASLIAATWFSLQQAGIAHRERAEAVVQRQIAEQQRALAAQRLLEAQQSRAEAERRSIEAEHQRERAEAQHALAAERYHDSRNLVATLLFDTHDRIMNLAGAVEARKIVLAKAREYLQKLLKEQGNDPGLLAELAAAYQRLGFLESESAGPAAAIVSHAEEVRLRRMLLARDPKQPVLIRSLGLALSRLAEAEVQAGKLQDAVGHAEESLRVAAAETKLDQEGGLVKGYLLTRLCLVFAASGSEPRAEPACREGIELLEPVPRIKPDDLQFNVGLAAAHAGRGNMLARGGRTAEGMREIEQGLTIYERMAVAHPNYAGVRRALAGATVMLAQAYRERKEFREAAAAYTRASKWMRELLAINPGDTQTVITLAYTLNSLATQLWKSGDQENAAAVAAQVGEMYRDLSERPGAGAREFNEYALFLAKTDVPQLRNPARALEYALRASRATTDANPFILDTLAWAYFANGDASKAAETSRRALSLLPKQDKPNFMADRLRKEIEQGLATFEHH